MSGFALWAALLGCGRAPEPLAPRHPDPWKGDQRALVLLLEWSDREAPVAPEGLREDFFGEQGSLAAWFAEASQGAFTLSGDVVGWKSVPEKWADRDPWLPTDVASLALEAFGDEVEAEQFDATGNGRIDHLFVVHSGRIGRDRVGPRWVFADSVADRTTVLQARGLGSVGEELALGFYLHEAGHRYFGLHDRYGDHRNGRYGIGIWGLMGLGQWGPNAKIPVERLHREPVHPRARAKLRIGWLRAKVVDETVRGLRIEPVENQGQVVRVDTPGDHQLVLEVRGRTGFHRALPGHGLLVWREPRTLDGEVVLLCADGRDDLERGTVRGQRPLPPNTENFGDASDPFPGSDGVPELADPVTGVRLENIRQVGEAVELDVVFPG